MSKTVILAINAKYVHSSLSVWVLAEGVSRYARKRQEVKIVEATINQCNNDIADKVIAHMPDIVSVSTYIWSAGKLPELLKLLRERLPEAVFVLGGPEASHNAEFWLDQGADFVLRGEGERSLPALLDALDINADIGSIPGLCRKAHINPAVEPPEEYIDPYSDAYFSALGGRIAYIETSRGCPFQCAFCLSAGSAVRFFPLDAVKEKLYRLSKSDTQTIKLVDRTFNCNAERAYELFEYIISLDTSCCFHFEVAADLFDERTLLLLCAAPPGRIQLEAGLQSFFEPALKASLRQTDIEKAESNIRTLISAGNIHIHLDLIAGLPYETLPDFQNSFDRAYALGAHTLQLGFLKLLHGSALRAQAESLGILYSQKPPYEFESSPWLSMDDIATLKQAEDSLQHTNNKGRFLSALRYVLSASGLRPFAFYRALGEAAPNHGMPLCDYARQLYDCCVRLPGVDADELKDYMTCDWLAMVKGENMPPFLRTVLKRQKQVAAAAEKQLGHKLRRNETAILRSGKGVFVDSEARNPVTGLYKLCFVEL